MSKSNALIGYSCFWLTFIASLVSTGTTHGGEAVPRSARIRELLKLIPSSTVSVFAVEIPFNLRRWDDLSQASVFESASCFTTMLVQRASLECLRGREVRCAIGAVRKIRNPKPVGTKSVINGPFQSQRCELFLMSAKLPTDWLDVIAKEAGAKIGDLIGHKVIRVPLSGEEILIVQLGDDMICIADQSGFLSEVLQLADVKAEQGAGSLTKRTAFHVAMSGISPSSAFWGIRLFGGQEDLDDPTSLRNRDSYSGVHDPQAEFITFQLPDVKSLNLQVQYASKDPGAGTRFVKSLLEKSVQVRTNATVLVNPNDEKASQAPRNNRATRSSPPDLQENSGLWPLRSQPP